MFFKQSIDYYRQNRGTVRCWSEKASKKLLECGRGRERALQDGHPQSPTIEGVPEKSGSADPVRRSEEPPTEEPSTEEPPTQELPTEPPATKEPAAGRPKLRGVIIDWGGVMTNPILETINAWIEAEGVDRARYTAVMRPWVSQAYDPDGAGNPIHALERGECTNEEFERLLADQLVLVDGGPVPADGLLARMFAATLPDAAMYETLRAIRRTGFQTCLLSNSWGGNDYPRQLFPELFDAVVISGETGMRKPEPRIFLHAATLLGLEPAECIFIDDIEANVQAAEAVGMVGVHHRELRSTTVRLSELLGIPLGSLTA
jgi:putative hydrolase of the HAD superfamily